MSLSLLLFLGLPALLLAFATRRSVPVRGGRHRGGGDPVADARGRG